MRYLRFALISLLLSSLLWIVACSNQSQSDNQLTLEEGVFSYAMSGLYKPFNYTDSKSGNLAGFDVEIGEALAKEMGMKPNPVTNPWESIIAGLQANKYDAIIGSMAITPERDKAVDFTNPYYRSGAQVFVQDKNTSIKSPEDLKGKKIGVVKASTFSTIAKEYTSEVTEYTSDVTALQDLPTGRIDAVITDQAVGFHAIQEENFPLKEVGKPLNLDEMAIAIPEGNEKLKEKINVALQAIIEDGTYDQISQKYFNRNILGEEQ
ncbi:ABC transporter substrate-binding protein [Polycladospora coralii]|uniref:ABC transporter substrate-binding protein n=1 Tax=Polycladospora coralii TaxID=2771432 RepID=UPI003D2FC15B